MLRACDNPFAVHRVLAQRYRLDERRWARLLARLASCGNRGTIVGSHGTGKTTLLEDLADRLERRGERVTMLRFDSSRRRLGPAHWGRETFVLCDGAEQLGWTDWVRLRWKSRSARGLVVTSHRDGLLPPLHRCETSPALLCELVASLGQLLSAEESTGLFERHGGNLRDALRELYDRRETSAALVRMGIP